MKPNIKFKTTLCGTYFTVYRGIIVTVEKSGVRPRASARWHAKALRRDNFRFVEDEALASFQCHSKTRQEAARFVVAGISCMANISINFARFVHEQEQAEKTREAIQKIDEESV